MFQRIADVLKSHPISVKSMCDIYWIEHLPRQGRHRSFWWLKSSISSSWRHAACAPRKLAMCPAVPTESSHSIVLHVAYATLENRTVPWALAGTMQAEPEGIANDHPFLLRISSIKSFSLHSKPFLISKEEGHDLILYFRQQNQSFMLQI